MYMLMSVMCMTDLHMPVPFNEQLRRRTPTFIYNLNEF